MFSHFVEERVVFTDRLKFMRDIQSPIVPSFVRLQLSRLSLAVLLAMPCVSVTNVLGEQPNTSVVLVAVQDAGASQAPLLSKGVDEFKAGKYEEALITLQGVKSDALSDADKKILADTIASSEQAVQQRKGARTDFNKGEEALANGKNEEAANYYKSVIANPSADDATKQKAKEQLAIVSASAGAAETDLKASYESAVADYKAHNYDAARSKFQKLQDSGYKAAWFSKSPREYLELIDKESAPKSTVEEARSAYLTGRDQYKKGDWIAARQNFNVAVEKGYKAGWFEESPQNYLAKMDKKEQADAEKAAAASVAAAAVVTTPAVETTAVVTPTTETPKVETPAVETPKVETTTTEVPKVETPAVVETPKTETTVTPVTPSVEATATPATEPAVEVAAVTTPAVNADREALEKLARENEAKAEQAKHIVDDAKAAENAQNLNTAATLFSKALELDPSNADALAGKTRTLHDAGLSPVKPDLATATEQRILAERQAILFNFNRDIEAATIETSNSNFDKASSLIEQAVVDSKTNPGIFTNEELQQFEQRIANARVSREQAILTKKSDDAQRAAIKAKEDAKAHDAEVIQARENAVAALIADARRLTDQGKYDEALKTIDQILTLDSRNSYAMGTRQLVADQATLKLQKNLRQKFNDEIINQFNETVEKKIPYSNILNYPENWPDISNKRDRTVREERSISDVDNQTVGLLEKSLPEIRFQDVAFSDVIDFLRDTTQANIFVNWKALEAAGIDRNAPVSTRLRNVKFSKVLRTILESVGGGATSQLSYTVDEGVITISTIEDLARNVETRTYDIRDLIISIPNFQQSNQTDNNDTGTDVTIGGDSGGTGGGSSGGSLFGNSGGDQNQNNDDNQTRTDLVDQITGLIRETIGVGTWKEDGGQLGSLRELSGQLVVTQTPEVHQQIQQLLEKLREQRSIQVTIETRFLTVQKNFLEDVGIDFDFFLNNDQNPFSGLVPGQATLPIGLDGKTQTGFSPINVAQASADFTAASTLQTGAPGNLSGSFANPNFSTQINAFLDDFQASILIRATQGNQSVTNVTAPRLTLFNGQSATINVDRVISYVSQLRPVVANGAVGYQTTISRLTSGITLGVTATVSSDRKYVTLTLTPTLTRLNGITTFQTLGATTTNNNGTVTTTGGGFVQLPDISRQRVRTSVSVPDGGTLLLGGATVTGEIEREAGVPVLSKIPFLKRAFTNRSSASDESILLILVKPTIIIQREIEQDTFPLLTSRAN